mgnify:FL=1
MMKNNYKKNLDYILSDGKIENIPITNLDLIKDILNDNDLGEKIYEEFCNNLEDISSDNCLMKVQDLIYRLSLLVNKILIEKYNITELDSIKNIIDSAMDNGIDLVSAVSYDESDKEILIEFEEIIEDIGINYYV